jgi:acetyltransferase
MSLDLAPLFEPRGIIVAGVSSHPGKFGFVALHNILASGYRGKVFAVSREPGEVLGVPVLASVDDVPDGEADLVFICTPPSANEALLRACAAKGVRAAFCAAGGYREAGPEGREAEDRLVAVAAEVGIVLAGPNGQGVVSPPASLCAQIVAPYPPLGRIGVASQSGNFVSAFLNLASVTGVGVSRAISAGNAAATGVVDYLEWYAQDPATAVSLCYLEGIEDGRGLYERIRAVAEQKPVVVLKGGSTSGGQRAAASHTGALASDDAVFDGMCRQAGLVRAHTVEEAFEAAATFASQPRPAPSGRVAVLTTAGGWGVVTADAITASANLELLTLPDDLLAAIDEHLPPRWSRNNPIDLAGGETRDTIPTLIDLVTAHPSVDAVILLGMGIQANQAALARSGPFHPDHGLERIVDFHERQDRRYAEAAVAASEQHGKPVLLATELAVARPDNAAVAATREAGRLAYWSANRAVAALDRMVGHERWRARRGLP